MFDGIRNAFIAAVLVSATGMGLSAWAAIERHTDAAIGEEQVAVATMAEPALAAGVQFATRD